MNYFHIKLSSIEVLDSLHLDPFHKVKIKSWTILLKRKPKQDQVRQAPAKEKKGKTDMIELKNIQKTYNGKDYAVKGLDLTIKDGEIFGFLGHNGAGKTTTLKMITGILEPTEGSITIGGYDIRKDPVMAKRQFAFVPDDPNVFTRFKGIEYLKFIADIYAVPKNERQQRIKTLAQHFDMEEALGDKIQSYSHGMRQKIVLIGALLYQPSIWILDEPMTGLDPKSSYQLKKLMREHTAQGRTVLFSTHVLDVAEKICDRIGIIDHGALRFVGTVEELRTQFSKDDSLEKMFLEMTDTDLSEEWSEDSSKELHENSQKELSEGNQK